MLNRHNQTSTNQWLILLAVIISLGWLIPNHYKPWTSFHTESWIALGLILFAYQAIFRGAKLWNVSLPLIFACLICLIPFVQYSFGLITWSGHAWISTLYLAGFFLAFLIGSNSSISHEQEGINTIFLSIGIAASVSVALQIIQWLNDDIISIWMMDVGRARPSANFGQPNLLATFQILGTISVGWWWQQKRLSSAVAIGWASYLLFGIALTYSRTAWINLGILLIFASIYKNIHEVQQIRKGLIFLVFWFICSILIISWINGIIFNSDTVALSSRLQESMRPKAWAMLIKAILTHPFAGYGWEQTGQAHIDMATLTPILGVHFGQAHNLFLDFMLWTGIPVGAAISIFFLWFIWKILMSLNSLTDLLLSCCVIVVGIHAMLELPLHYAYFLIPVGFFTGVLWKRVDATSTLCISKFTVIIIISGISILFAIIVRDYFISEARFSEMLHQKAKIGANHPKLLPDTLILNQMKGIVEFAYYEPKSDAESWRFKWAEHVTLESPSMANFNKLALLLGLNGHPNEATLWLRRGCSVLTTTECYNLSLIWKEYELDNQNLLNIFPYKMLESIN